LLDRNPGVVYTPDVCRAAEVLPFAAPVFIDLFDYTTLRSVSVVFTGNVHAGTLFPLPVFMGMNIVAPLLHYICIG
jgi:hypothetical protein